MIEKVSGIRTVVRKAGADLDPIKRKALHAAEHRSAHEDQHRRGRIRGHEPGRRREKQTGQKADRGENGRQPGAPSISIPRGTSIKAVPDKYPDQRRSQRRERIRQSVLPQDSRFPARIEDSVRLRDADERRDQWKEIREQDPHDR